MKNVSCSMVFITCLLGTAISCVAQSSYHIPEGTKLETEQQCREHNDDFLKASDYLLSTPIDAANRKEASDFCMKWMTNSPDVRISYNTGTTKRFDKSEDLLLIYMLGWSRYVLSSHDTDLVNGSIAGYRTVLDYYKNPAFHVPRTKKLDKLVKLQSEGKLEEEVEPMVKLRNWK